MLIKAFNAVGKNPVPTEWLQSLLDSIHIRDNMPVEDIQTEVQKALMKHGCYKTAAAYIAYREEHKNTKLIRDKINYILKYSASSGNAATNSNTDANANNSVKNVSSIEPEVFKDKNRLIQRQLMKDTLSKLYPESGLGKQYIDDLLHHIIYSHDESCSPIPKAYCGAYTLYPLIQEGVGNIDAVTPTPPNDIQSFSGQVTNLIFALSAQTKGAVACLYKNQPLIINDKTVTIKDFVKSRWSENPIISNDWEYCPVSDARVLEDGKYVDIKRVYRRKYKDRIYKIVSNKGLTACTSKDHKFKVLRNGKIEEVTAENLHIFDTVVINKTIPIDYTNPRYKNGWLVGMLLGDGNLTQKHVSLSVNYNQEYYAEIFNNYSSELYGKTLVKHNGHKCFNYDKWDLDYYVQIKKYISGTNTFDKNITDADTNLTYLVGVLDGVLCADGGDYHSIGISLVNKGLIDTISNILNKLDIKYSYKEIAEHDNKSKLYCLTISSEVLKYTPNLRLKLKETKVPKEVFYYSGYSRERNIKHRDYILPTGKNKFKFPQLKTDVITNITTFDNDDEYVYEIETSSHWYNCGGYITHNCGDYMIALNYYVIKEFGPKWYDKLDEVICNSNVVDANKRTIRREIKKGMKQFIYGVNQPQGNRGFQSPLI